MPVETQIAAATQPVPAGVKNIKALTFDAFIEAVNRHPLKGAFEIEQGTQSRRAILYLDKFCNEHPLSQDVWFEHIAERDVVSYVVRVVDHNCGDAIAQSQCELTLEQAALLLDQSIEQQLGLIALRNERARAEARSFD